ncbi:MAG: hypothetical protein FWG36_08265, partial [Oscillospiraceae bacterium]|nr:hypothetical protein [Oscillospiraceae bacterium]
EIRQLQDKMMLEILINQSTSTVHQQNRLNAASAFIGNFGREIYTFKTNFKPFDVFSKYQSLENLIKEYIIKEKIVPKEINGLFNSFGVFRDKTQRYYQNEDSESKIELHNIITKICNDYHKIIDSYSWFIKNLEENQCDYDAEKYKLLDVKLLGVEFEVAEFADKIYDISEIYKHISGIYPCDKDYKIQSLKIVKIESGSLDFSVLGDKIIIEVICGLIVCAVKALLKYFKEHKKPMPNDEINAILDERLNEISSQNGTAKHKNHIKKRIINFTSKFCTIKINSESYSYEGDDISKMLPFLEKKLLSEKTEDNDNKN